MCVRRSCDAFYNNESVSNITDSLEACLNESLWKEYGLKAKLLKTPQCRSVDDRIELDYTDKLVAVLCASILIVNIAGTLYDFYSTKKSKSKGIIFIVYYYFLTGIKCHLQRYKQKCYQFKGRGNNLIVSINIY